MPKRKYGRSYSLDNADTDSNKVLIVPTGPSTANAVPDFSVRKAMLVIDADWKRSSATAWSRTVQTVARSTSLAKLRISCPEEAPKGLHGIAGKGNCAVNRNLSERKCDCERERDANCEFQPSHSSTIRFTVLTTTILSLATKDFWVIWLGIS